MPPMEATVPLPAWIARVDVETHRVATPVDCRIMPSAPEDPNESIKLPVTSNTARVDVPETFKSPTVVVPKTVKLARVDVPETVREERTAVPETFKSERSVAPETASVPPIKTLDENVPVVAESAPPENPEP